MTFKALRNRQPVPGVISKPQKGMSDMGSMKDQSQGRPSATQTGENTAHDGDRGEDTLSDHLLCVYHGFTHTISFNSWNNSQVLIISIGYIRNLDHSNIKTVLRVSLLGKAGTRTDKQSLSVFNTFVIFAGPTALLLRRSAVFWGLVPQGSRASGFTQWIVI